MKSRILILFLLIFCLFSCATPAKVTYTETVSDKAKSIDSAEDVIKLSVQNLQVELDNLLDIASKYVIAYPEKNAYWKETLLPMFKEANTTIGELIRETKQVRGAVFYPVSYSRAEVQLKNIRQILIGWGAIAK